MRSSCELRENIVAGIVCLFGMFALPLLYLEKDSALVRFYLVQNFLFWLVFAVLGAITCGIGYIVALVFWIIMLVNAFQGKKYSVPVIGNWVDKIMA